MSSYTEDEDTDVGSLAEMTRHLQKVIGDIPRQVDIVSDLSASEVKRLRKELRKVHSPRAPVKKVTPPQLPQTAMPTVPTTDTRYGTFAGRRHKAKNVMDIMMGRR